MVIKRACPIINLLSHDCYKSFERVDHTIPNTLCARNLYSYLAAGRGENSNAVTDDTGLKIKNCYEPRKRLKLVCVQRVIK